MGNGRLTPGVAAPCRRWPTWKRAANPTLLVARDGQPIAVLAAADTVRPEVPAALAEVRALGIQTHRTADGRYRAGRRRAGRQLGYQLSRGPAARG